MATWGNMNEERYNKIVADGNIQDVCELIERKTGLEINYIMRKLPYYVESIKSDRQSELFQLYYFFHYSIIKIHYSTGLQYKRIETHIEKAIENLIEMFEKDAAIINNKRKGEPEKNEKGISCTSDEWT